MIMPDKPTRTDAASTKKQTVVTDEQLDGVAGGTSRGSAGRQKAAPHRSQRVADATEDAIKSILRDSLKS